MKKEYTIYVNVNGGEYLDKIRISCENIKAIDKCTLIADGIIITFREDMYAICLDKKEIWYNY